jgi:hypothetical protein
MAAANDNSHVRRKRGKAEASRSLATMTRIIQDIYGPKSTQQLDAACVEGAPDVAPSQEPLTPHPTGHTVAH